MTGEQALGRPGQPEQDAEHPPQRLYAHPLADHIRTVRREEPIFRAGEVI
jgi:hypothetical protein